MSNTRFKSNLRKTLIVVISIAVIFGVFFLATLPEKAAELDDNTGAAVENEEATSDDVKASDWQGLWKPAKQVAFLMVLLGISLIIKSNIGFFKKHLIPTTLFGGLVGFVIGQVIWPKVFNWAPVFDSDMLLNLVYHATSIGFIAMALKKRKKKSTENITNTGFAIVNTYILQATLGLGAMIVLVATILPQFENIFGVMLPLAFAQGPGQATATGRTLEALGMSNGIEAGAALATFGFLWAIIGGIPFMNVLRRKYKKQKANVEMAKVDTDPDIHEHTARVPRTLFMDDLTVQIVLIGVVYLLTYLALVGLDALPFINDTLMTVLWGFQFLFGTLMALIVRKILNVMQKKKVIRSDYADNYLLQRVSSSAFDIMIIASICAISLDSVIQYIWPLLILSSIGGVFTMIYSYRMSKWMFKEEQMEHAIGLYGMWTGTIVTGMALLKEVDPEGKTSVPESLVLGSGIGALIGFPLMMILAIPITAWADNNPNGYIVTFGLFAVYSIVCFLGIYFSKRIYARRRAKKQG